MNARSVTFHFWHYNRSLYLLTFLFFYSVTLYICSVAFSG